MFPLLYLKARRSSTSCSKILAETSEKSKIIQNITIKFNGKEIMFCLLRSGCSHSANILLGRYLRRGFFFVRTVLILIQIRPTEIDIKSLQWREVAFSNVSCATVCTRKRVQACGFKLGTIITWNHSADRQALGGSTAEAITCPGQRPGQTRQMVTGLTQ